MRFGASTFAVLLFFFHASLILQVEGNRLLKAAKGHPLYGRQDTTTNEVVVSVDEVTTKTARPSTKVVFQTSTADTVTIIHPPRTTPGSSLETRTKGPNKTSTTPIVSSVLITSIQTIISLEPKITSISLSVSTSSEQNNEETTDQSKTPSVTPPPEPTCAQGHFSCAAQFSGGCCPSGWDCAADACIAPATVTDTRTCLPSSYLCPDSIGGGCCPNGYSCGATACVPADLGPITVTQDGVVVVQTYEITQTEVLPKATDEPISIKLSPTLPAPSSTGDATRREKKKPFVTVKTAAIAGGACAAIIIIVLAVLFAWRKVKRRGNTAWGNFRDRSDIVAAPTGRAYDPNAPPPPRQSRFTPHFYSHRIPPAQLHGQQSNFGFPGQPPLSPGHMEAKPAYYLPEAQEAKYAPVSLDSPPPEATFFGKEVHSPIAELRDTSGAHLGPRGSVYEVDSQEQERGRRSV